MATPLQRSPIRAAAGISSLALSAKKRRMRDGPDGCWRVECLGGKLDDRLTGVKPS